MPSTMPQSQSYAWQRNKILMLHYQLPPDQLTPFAELQNLSTIANDLASALWPGPLTLLTIAQDSLSWNIGQAGSALAVRVPHHEVAQQVLSGIGPTVMTGAQRMGETPVQTVEQAQAALTDLVDVYLDGGALIPRISTVIDATTDHIRLIRKGELTLAQVREIMPIVIDATAS
jgi:L-threonylcarbamoyladenylate synthase